LVERLLGDYEEEKVKKRKIRFLRFLLLILFCFFLQECMVEEETASSAKCEGISRNG
jgi:hypothetical protein